MRFGMSGRDLASTAQRSADVIVSGQCALTAAGDQSAADVLGNGVAAI